MAVATARTREEILACWPVMKQLRPHLVEEQFVALVRRQMKEGYRIAFIRDGKAVVALAGLRILNNLAWGRFCYVDDLVTDERGRSKGYGRQLMEWLTAYARRQGCDRLELDSGVQRHGAHRFYLRERMWISCYHFSLELHS